MFCGALQDYLAQMTVVFLVIINKSENAPSCPEHTPLICAEYNECYSREERCDGTIQCTDGTDEHSSYDFFVLKIVLFPVNLLTEVWNRDLH